jgi:hypothetical protein
MSQPPHTTGGYSLRYTAAEVSDCKAACTHYASQQREQPCRFAMTRLGAKGACNMVVHGASLNVQTCQPADCVSPLSPLPSGALPTQCAAASSCTVDECCREPACAQYEHSFFEAAAANDVTCLADTSLVVLSTAVSRQWKEGFSTGEFTPLMFAAKHDSLNAARFLLDTAHVDVNVMPVATGYTAVMLAARVGSLPIVKLLVANGARIWEPSKKASFRHWAAAFADESTGDGVAVKQFLQTFDHCNVDYISNHQLDDLYYEVGAVEETLLMRTAARGDLFCVQFIVAQGASVDVRDTLGRTVLQRLAARRRRGGDADACALQASIDRVVAFLASLLPADADVSHHWASGTCVPPPSTGVSVGSCLPSRVCAQSGRVFRRDLCPSKQHDANVCCFTPMHRPPVPPPPPAVLPSWRYSRWGSCTPMYNGAKRKFEQTRFRDVENCQVADANSPIGIRVDDTVCINAGIEKVVNQLCTWIRQPGGRR